MDSPMGKIHASVEAVQSQIAYFVTAEGSPSAYTIAPPRVSAVLRDIGHSGRTTVGGLGSEECSGFWPPDPRCEPTAQQRDTPWTRSQSFPAVFKHLPVADDEVELLVCAHVLLSAEPHRSQADFTEDTHFQRPGVNAAVTSDRDPIAFGHNRHPCDVDGSERNLRQIGMTGVDDIGPGVRQQLAEAESALVHEPSKRHLPGYLSGGPRQAQLEAQGLLHLSDREIEQVGDRLNGFAGSKLLGDHLRRHRPHYRSPVLMQRIERDQPPELHRDHGVRLPTGISGIVEIVDEALHRGRDHRLPTSDHHEHLVTGDTNLLLNMANKLTAIDIKERPGVRKRIPTELLTQPDHRGTQTVHGRTSCTELGEQPRLDELPPGHFLITGTFGANNRRVVHPTTVVTINPPPCRARRQHEKPVDVRQSVDTAIEQRDRHRSILSRVSDRNTPLRGYGASEPDAAANMHHLAHVGGLGGRSGVGMGAGRPVLVAGVWR